MFREFSVFLEGRAVSAIPLSGTEVCSAQVGQFSAEQQLGLDAALTHFPLSERLDRTHPAWRVPNPAGGSLRVQMADDHSRLRITGEATVELVLRVFVSLHHAVPQVAIEDLLTHVVHDRGSLLRLAIFGYDAAPTELSQA